MYRRLFLHSLIAASFLVPVAAVAQDKKTLTVYTYESFVSEWGPGPKVKAAFEETCNCTVNFVGVADGVALLNRLKLEGPSSKADVVVGLDTNLIAEAKQTGLFEASGVDTSAAKVPGGFTDDVFVPYDYSHFAVVYDTQTLKNPPKSMKDLVEGDPSQKIVIQDPRTSTPGLGLLLWVKSVYGDKAPEAWAKLKNRVLTVTPGWSESYGLFTKGEVPMVLSYTTSPAYHMVSEKTDRYQAASSGRGALYPDRSGRHLEERAGKSAGEAVPRLYADDWFSGCHSGKQLDDAGCCHVCAAAGCVFQAGAAVQDISDVAGRGGKNRKAWIDEWLAAMSVK